MKMFASMTQTDGEEDGLEDGMRSLTGATDESDGSDFTPAQLEMMKRKISGGGVPLPGGVQDVQWEAPRSTGLEHSDAIFETEADTKGGIRLTSKGINNNNCHYRSWQEDNGVAKSFACRSVVKNVDGRSRTVLISPGTSMRLPKGSTIAPMTSSLRTMVRSSPTASSAKESGQEDNTVAGEGQAADRLSLPRDGPDKHTPSVPLHPSADVVSDAANENSGAQFRSNVGSLACKGNATGPSCSSTTGPAEDIIIISPRPRRPSTSPASSTCHGQRPHPGRSLSTKVLDLRLYPWKVCVDIG